MDRTMSARQAAEARWSGGDLDSGQLERVSMAVLTAWCARAGLSLSTARDGAPFHALISAADTSWIVPVLLKGVARDGITVSPRHLDFPGVIVWAMLGKNDGGMDSRTNTSMIVLTPRQAWDLPRRLGTDLALETPSYRWPQLTRALREELADHTTTDTEQFGALLARHAWRPPATFLTDSTDGDQSPAASDPSASTGPV